MFPFKRGIRRHIVKGKIIFMTLVGGDKEDMIQEASLGWRDHGSGDLPRGEIGLDSEDSMDLYLITKDNL